MIVLGIETSCDETGIGAVAGEPGGLPRLLAHRLHSQVDLHAAYGGVVPELASRDHVRRTVPLIEQTLEAAGLSLRAIDAIAVTAGPGLGGALLVGASIAHGLAYALRRPVVPVHHLEGHLLSPLLSRPAPAYPFVALLVSGGHTQLMRVDGLGRYELLGETLDDAAGEAFDKTAQLLALGYPGGPAVSRLAEFGVPGAFEFPRPLLRSASLDFSFSGLKTAVLTSVRQATNLCEQVRADIARGFVDAVVDVLARKSMLAMRRTGIDRLVVSGGVGANRQLRERLRADVSAAGGELHFPPLQLCTDNGAMIALAGWLRLDAGEGIDALQGFSVRPRWALAPEA